MQPAISAIPSLYLKQAENLLSHTQKELNYLVACLLQTSSKDASRFTGTFSKLLVGKISALGATGGILGLVGSFGTAGTGTAIATLHGAAATSATLAWVGGLVGGGMLAGSIATGGLGFVAGIGTYKLLSSKAKEYDKLNVIERHFVDKSTILIQYINEWLEKKELIAAEDLQTFSKNSLEPLVLELLEHKSEIEKNLDIKNKLLFQTKVLRNLKSLLADYDNYNKPTERNLVFSAITDKLSSLKIKNPKEVIQNKIREKAIKNAKERLMYQQLTPEELGLDKFEVIVQEEEQKIHDNIKNMSFVSIVGLLGLDNLLG